MNHRLLQRTIFRMLLDPDFRAAILRREAAAEPELEAAELDLLAALDPAALGADPGGARRRQILGNLLLEFPLSAAFAPEAWRRRGFPDAFLGSAAFHEAVRRDRPLPLAFAEFLLEHFGAGEGLARDLLRLEAAMARCRREDGPSFELATEEVLLAPGVALHETPEGLVTLAEEARAAMARGEPPVGPKRMPAARQTCLLVRRPRANPWAQAEIAVEALSGAVAGLLRLAQRPLPRSARLAYAESLGTDEETVEAFTADLVADGVLIRSR